MGFKAYHTQCASLALLLDHTSGFRYRCGCQRKLRLIKPDPLCLMPYPLSLIPDP